MAELNLRQMRYAIAMADHGTISGAARALDLTQPALSGSLRELESALGVTLFVRARGRALTPTAEGRVLLPEIRRLVADALDVEQRAQGLVAPSTGTVRVGSLVTVAPILLAPLLRAFRDEHPSAGLGVTTGDQQALLAGLGTGDLHMALTYDLDIDEGIEFVPIADVPPKVLLPSSHPLASRRSIRLDALRDEPFVLLDLPLSADYFQAVFLAAKVSMRPALRCSDLGFVRSLVAEHMGFSVVNLVPSSRGDDGLAYVSIDGDVPTLRLGFAMSDRPLPPVASAFRDIATTLLPRLLRTRANRR